GVVGLDVDGRVDRPQIALRPEVAWRLGPPRARGCDAAVRPRHHMPRPPQEGAEARARQEEAAGEREQDAEDPCARRAEAERGEALEAAAEEAAVRAAERQHQPGDRDRETESERA